MGLGGTAAAAANRNLRTHLHKIMTKLTYAFNPVLKWRPGLKDGAEVLLLALALPIYYLVRGQVTQRVSEAVDRGVGIVHFEQSLGIFWEPDLQRAVLDYHWFVDGLNYFYLFGHFAKPAKKRNAALRFNFRLLFLLFGAFQIATELFDSPVVCVLHIAY